MKNGIIAAMSAYVLWGVFPLYMKLVSHMPVLEVLAHRIIWALPTALIMLFFMKRTKDLKAALHSPQLLFRAALTAFLITLNWGTYIWAITHDHTLDAALGYYISPILSVLLGAIFLKERLTFWQWFAFALEVLAVLILAFQAGKLPWVAIIIPLTFSLYGFFRKSMPIGPAQGFALEAFILFLPAILVALYFVHINDYHFAHGSLYDDLLLIGMGPFTAIPLILFSSGAKKLSLAALGLMQYISPTFLFLIAVFFLKEPFSWPQFWAFSLIWLSLIIYTASGFKQANAKRAKKAKETL